MLKNMCYSVHVGVNALFENLFVDKKNVFEAFIMPF